MNRKKTNEMASEALNQGRAFQAEIKSLKQREERMNRVMRAMLEVLEQKLGVSQSEIEDIVRRIESEEIGPGGVVIRTADVCANCDRPIQENSTKCIYCGSLVKTPLL